MESTDERKALMADWIAASFDEAPLAVDFLAGDASFRRYYRVTLPTSQTVVLMDAPPTLETTASFISIAKLLRAHGIHAPAIIAADTVQGFLVLTDLGDRTYQKTLTQHNADTLYGKALDTLAIMQDCHRHSEIALPLFNKALMLNEWDWHGDWFLGRWLGFTSIPNHAALTACYRSLVASALAQPQVFMHRDYHSANLMWLPQEDVGVLDFQDAFIGPVTYDLASLLRDCYIDWPSEQVMTWAASYLDRLQQQGIFARISEQQFIQWFDFMSLQRHIKALFTFARKAVRDQQPAYLRHVPRTLHYIISVAQAYPTLRALHQFYQYDVMERLAQHEISKDFLCAR